MQVQIIYSIIDFCISKAYKNSLILHIFYLLCYYTKLKKFPSSLMNVRVKPCVLVCMCAQSLSHIQFFTTPWTKGWQTLLSMGFSRQAYWNGLPFPPPGEFSWPRDRTHDSCISRQILYHCTTWEALNISIRYSMFYFLK